MRRGARPGAARALATEPVATPVPVKGLGTNRSAEAPDRPTTAAHATVRLASITGATAAATPDPTEDYHEASRIYPGVVDPLVVGAARLERSVTMRVSATRSVKRHAHRPVVELPRGDLGGVRARRRARGATLAPSIRPRVALARGAGNAARGRLRGHGSARRDRRRRSAPPRRAARSTRSSCTWRAGGSRGSRRALHHYDPLRHVLEELRPLDAAAELPPLTPYDELVRGCAALVVVTGVLWRSRFKYGARAYRFTLLEAGHVAQSFLLAVEALAPRLHSRRWVLRPPSRCVRRRRRHPRDVALPPPGRSPRDVTGAPLLRLGLMLAIAAAAALVAPTIAAVDPRLHRPGEALVLGCVTGLVLFTLLARRHPCVARPRVAPAETPRRAERGPDGEVSPGGGSLARARARRPRRPAGACRGDRRQHRALRRRAPGRARADRRGAPAHGRGLRGHLRRDRPPAGGCCGAQRLQRPGRGCSPRNARPCPMRTLVRARPTS